MQISGPENQPNFVSKVNIRAFIERQFFLAGAEKMKI
jgi:hypothetical protein